MVFKTTCVGSIPATLVIVNFSHTTKNLHIVKYFSTKTSKKQTARNALRGRQKNKQFFNYRNSLSSVVMRTKLTPQVLQDKRSVIGHEYSPKQNLSSGVRNTTTLKLNYQNTPPMQRNSSHLTPESTLEISLSSPVSDEDSRHPTFKTRVPMRSRKQRHSAWGWLLTTLKHINRYNYLGLSSEISSKTSTSSLENVSATSKNLQTLFTKRKNALRLTIRNLRFRTKAMRYAGMYETVNSARYAMTFKKNKTLDYDSTDYLTHSNTNKVLNTFNIAFLLNSRQVFSLHSQIINIQPYCGLTKYKLAQMHEAPANLLTNPNVNLMLYTNSITELYFNNNFKNLSRITRPQDIWNDNSQTPDKSTLPLRVLHAKQQQNNYTLPILNCWMLESRFVRPRSAASRSAVFILAKAPSYRLSRTSESPISSSQHYGNLYNRNSSLPYNHASPFISSLLQNTVNPLLVKSVISASTISFLKPYKNTLRKNTLTLISNKMKNSSIKTLSTLYQNLLYTPSVVSHSLTVNQSTNSQLKPDEITDGLTLNRQYPGLYRSINLKNKPVSRRFVKKNQYNGAPAPASHKPGFVEDVRSTSKNKKSTLLKAARTIFRKLARFSKWKTKKATFFFAKFRKLNKNRKSSLRSLVRPHYLFNKSSKYQSSSMLHTKGMGKLNQQLLKTYTPNGTGVYLSVAYQKQLNITVPYKLGMDFSSMSLTHSQTLWLLLLNPFTLKNLLFAANISTIHKTFAMLLRKNTSDSCSIFLTNLVPHHSFQKHFSKKVLNSFANRLFREDIIPYYQNTLIRFMEYCTGRKVLFQFYPFVNQHIDKSYMVRYKRWLPRMNFYERRLGHKFFLEEALHIMHISFVLRDPKIIASWLKAIILRISFWKTRSIFRFLKYLFHNYFTHVFDDIRIKGLKIRLKGKISSAGNSRKRTILYRVGRTSHSEVNLRVVKDFSLINTFTGVMGFQVYLFY